MLKKITVEELTLGMHLHELCGGWLDHPFWKTQFVLTDPADLSKLRDSGVTHCWIDLAKSRAGDVAAAEPTVSVAAPEVTRIDESAAAPARARETAFDEELRHAATLVQTIARSGSLAVERGAHGACAGHFAVPASRR